MLLGYAPGDVIGFQTKAQAAGFLPKDVPGKPTQLDGDAGPKTRSAMHVMLADKVKVVDAKPVTPAPVVTEKEVEVAVVPKGADKPGVGRWIGSIPLPGAPIMAFGAFDNVTKAVIGGAVLPCLVSVVSMPRAETKRTRKLVPARPVSAMSICLVPILPLPACAASEELCRFDTTVKRFVLKVVFCKE